jgi:uncharacterized protein (TIGR00290 family)
MKVAVFWSGGKDSALAYYKAITEGHNVAFIVTFIFGDWPFVCHPMPIIQLQSEALGTAHLIVKVEEPYREKYRAVLSRLKKEAGIEGIVTGDIWIEDHKRWNESVCEGLGLKVIMPLWGLARHQILNEVISSGFKCTITCVKQPWFDEGWLGRELDLNCIRDLKVLNMRHGIDLCGENGEYHTMVVDGPVFKEIITISSFSIERRDKVMFLKINQCSLKRKD